ncbi:MULTISPECIES: TetR/AcrR family transcriptional regulator [Gordonia]|uniref:TetR family transcriptional regulator n=2 Tax=Gordonia alkanivorans TaxID=84096 RepID=W9D7J6_9ACTN|nr:MULTISPECIES: TetR family transcriptional regulator [Gordonia]ETA05238.1 TetR family transcriptional regulator [Gordonia alkanivorans CGMCC 6845]MDH3007857.1 helix-turn-helix domain containing protein [Gordonia alkanivorans]MDH3016782.1 helix-turn-helix domain containing protein [Gordonia alkanivorans]MDH3026426.1 helix-turn-helix domain containing protein [Gordonia alkanivorans]MDH3042027.1 helix-turn-helix domain containing protein [Gordonia alkanivorans]
MTVRAGTSTSDTSQTVAPGIRRRRPTDRRRLIIDAAAKAFSDGGYHAVRLDDIADAVGISAPALYRHFPNKYALFAETTAVLARSLRSALDAVEPGGDDELRELLVAITAASFENRRTGGLYRWESRYLAPADRDLVRDVVVHQHRRVRAAARRLRPDLRDADANLTVAAMTSVAASPTTHHSSLPAREVTTLISDAAFDLLDVDLPDPVGPPAPAAHGLAPAAKREIILTEAINLFAARGFRDVTIEDIAHAAGLPASGVYRHFPSKVAILEAAFWRATDRVTAAIAEALADASTPHEALVGMMRRYVRLTCSSTDLISVYETEIGHATPEARDALRHQQRITVDEWATWMSRERANLPITHARFLVHAALNVVTDLSRLRPQPSPERIEALSARILLGGNATPTAPRSRPSASDRPAAPGSP